MSTNCVQRIGVHHVAVHAHGQSRAGVRAAHEAGSLGTNVWNFFGSKAAFFGLVTLSHVVGLGAGYTVLARRAPWELWTVLVAAAPLIVQRQAYVRSELRRGAPSGEFGD